MITRITGSEHREATDRVCASGGCGPVMDAEVEGKGGWWDFVCVD